MNFEALSGLVKACETMCSSGCCGVYAFDFSPINIGRYLLRFKSQVDEAEVSNLRNELNKLLLHYEASLNFEKHFIINEINQKLSGNEVVILLKEIQYNLEVALALVVESQSRRFQNSLFEIERNRKLVQKRHPKAKPESNL